MIARSFDPIAELQSAFNVLTKNLSLIAIPVVAFVVVGLIFTVVLISSGASAFLASGADNPMAWGAVIGGAAIAFGIGCVVAIIVLLLAEAAVIAGSEAVWEGRSPDIGAGVGRAFSRAGDLFIAGLVLAIIAIAISWTIVGPLALGFLMIYVAPAIVVGGENSFAAMGTSWRMSTQNFGPTFGAFAGIIVVSVAGGIVNAIIGHVPIIGLIAACLVSAFTTAYAALVTVRFYDLLRGTAVPQVVVPPPPPPVA